MKWPPSGCWQKNQCFASSLAEWIMNDLMGLPFLKCLKQLLMNLFFLFLTDQIENFRYWSFNIEAPVHIALLSWANKHFVFVSEHFVKVKRPACKRRLSACSSSSESDDDRPRKSTKVEWSRCQATDILIYLYWWVFSKVRLAIIEPQHDKTNSDYAQQRLRSAQSDQSLMSTWRKLGSLATHWSHSEDPDQTGRMPQLPTAFMKLCDLSCLVTKQTVWLCAQRRLKSTWAYALFDQSLRCPHEERLGP